MIRACDEAGVKLFIVKQNRFNVPVVKAREALEAGRFGRLILGTVRVRWCRDQAYYDHGVKEYLRRQQEAGKTSKAGPPSKTSQPPKGRPADDAPFSVSEEACPLD